MLNLRNVVLVESVDHTFRECVLIEEDVVYNYKTQEFCEYAGQELNDNEKLMCMKVAR